MSAWQVKDEQRFRRMVSKSENGCWVWTGSRTRTGYGYFRIHGRTVRAHRLAFEMANGPIPNGLCVCHRCDNPSCVNVDHLFLGTHTENMRDMAQKKRGRSWPRETNPRARLSQADVTTIRASAETRGALAARFGVSLSLISAVKNWKVWR